MQEDVVFLAGDAERELLQRIQDPARHEESHEVARGTHRHMTEGQMLRRPIGKGQLPRQIDQVDRGVTQPEAGEGGQGVAGSSNVRVPQWSAWPVRGIG